MSTRTPEQELAHQMQKLKAEGITVSVERSDVSSSDVRPVDLIESAAREAGVYYERDTPLRPIITVYTKPACVQCDSTKAWLNSRGLDYDTDDIYEEKNLEAVQALGYLAAPVVIVSFGGIDDEVHWSGFRPDKLGEHLQRFAA